MGMFVFAAISVAHSDALDYKGFKREDAGGSVHCGGDMSSSGFDGTTDGFGDLSPPAQVMAEDAAVTSPWYPSLHPYALPAPAPIAG
jgi:hypothetical protein